MIEKTAVQEPSEKQHIETVYSCTLWSSWEGEQEGLPIMRGDENKRTVSIHHWDLHGVQGTLISCWHIFDILIEIMGL